MSKSSCLTLEIEPEIIYEDEELLIIDKPPGLHSVKLAESKEYSLAQWLIERDPKLAKVSRNAGDGGLVQRLDFATSGLMIVAKNNQIWESLHKKILQSEIEKHYYCLLEGILEQTKLKVDLFIGSPYRAAKKVRVYKRMPEKPHRALEATTTFELIKANKLKNCCLVRAIAPTARRHQIRAHAASIGHALVGDSLYRSTASLGDSYPVAFYLQASALSFLHPVSRKRLEFKLEVPEQIIKILSSTLA